MAPSSSVAVLTDSSSQLTPELACQFGVTVVPVHVVVDGTDYLEGLDLSADEFYRVVESAKELPTVATSQPTPAQFTEAFETAAASGAEQVLAVLVGSEYSGSVNSATVAAASAPIPVRIIDSGTASFGISCCLWAAAGELETSGSVDAAVAAAEKRAAELESVFVLQGLELVRQSGRFGAVADEIGRAEEEIAVLWTGQGRFEVLASVRTVEEAVGAMVDRIVATDRPLVAAVGRAGAQTAMITDRFRDRVEASPQIKNLVEYRVGPSIAAHTGPGTAGGFIFPV